MSDIFLSYASEDRERAKALAHTLETQGWSVWWDRKIAFDQPFDEVIAESLAAARCVIVLWTKISVESRWVRAEASEGEARDVLIPVMLDADVKVPLEFKALQAANLSDWEPECTHAELERLLDNIKEVLAAAQFGKRAESSTGVAAASAMLAMNPKAKAGRKALLVLGLIALPSLLVIGATLALMNWRIPTRMQADLVADRVEFTLGGVEAVPILDRATSFRTLTVEHFSRVAFIPKELDIGDAVLPTSEDDHNDPWARVPVAGEVVLSGEKDDVPVLTIESAKEKTELVGKLEAISAKPGTSVIVKVNRDSSPSLTIRFAGESFAPAVLPADPFKLIASHVSIRPAFPMLRTDPIKLRARLGEDSPFVQVESDPRAFVVTLTPVNNAPIELLAKSGVPVAKVDFSKQNERGGIETVLVGGGRITYTDYPSKGDVVVDEHEFIRLDALRGASITWLRYDPEKAGLTFRVDGEAGIIRTRSGDLTNDHRLSVFDRLWHGSRPAIILSIVVWVFSVTVGAYKMYEEKKRRE
ncbi:MAG: toll/interleukin-1 receptor domain-containing protein [Gammaproteobacteria bacterium]